MICIEIVNRQVKVIHLPGVVLLAEKCVYSIFLMLFGSFVGFYVSYVCSWIPPEASSSFSLCLFVYFFWFSTALNAVGMICELCNDNSIACESHIWLEHVDAQTENFIMNIYWVLENLYIKHILYLNCITDLELSLYDIYGKWKNKCETRRNTGTEMGRMKNKGERVTQVE